MSDRGTIRIFISSPSDVRPERLRAEAIVARLNNEFAYHFAVEPVLWEREPLVASHHFQHEDNIPQPHRADIVVVILWTRLGVTLPADQFLGALSGGPVTGTEWEFEDALASARERGTPDLLLYRKDAPPTADLTDRTQLQDRLAQLDMLEGFIGRWFRSQDGKGFTAASHSFHDATEFEDKLYEHLRALLERRVGGAAGTAEIRWHEAPFRGLAPFGQAQSAVFFGRTRARNELRETLARRDLRGPAFVLVLGASGSGKSSLVQAGLLPDLMLPGMIGRVALVRYASLRPSDRPQDLVGGLAAALLSATALPELADLRYTPDRLADLLRRAPDQVALPVEQGLAAAERAASLPALAQSRLLLIVDQLEELFTIDGLEPSEQLAFVAALDALARTGLVWIVATMRSDFFDRLELLPSLARLADAEGCYRLLPPDTAELAQIIRQPAREAGLRFAVDPHRGVGLDEVILQAAGRDRGALPLLSFLLDQLWQHRTARGELTFETYAALGELEGALGSHAETVFAAQAVPLQESLPTLLRALVTLGSGAQPIVASRTAPLDAFLAGSPARGLLDAFLDPAARLLVADDQEGGSARVRVAHEALLTHWPRARDWIAERPADLQLEDRIETEAARWAKAAERDRPSLLRAAGLPLSEAQDLLARRRDDLSLEAVAYIEASIAQEEARQEAERRRTQAEQALQQEAAEAEAARQRQAAASARQIAARTRAGLLVACALLVVAAGLAWLSYQRTIEAQIATARAQDAAVQAEGRLAEARLNASRFITEHAEAELRALHPELAARLARAALPEDLAQPNRPLWYPAASVIGEAGAADRALAVLPHGGTVGAVAISPDGQRIATASWDNTARLWEASTGRLLQVLPHDGWVVSAAFSPDGTRLATGSLDKTARVWDGRTGVPMAIMRGHESTVNAAVFSPEGSRLATASNDGTARVWDVASGLPLTTMRGHSGVVGSVVWSPDGNQVATASMDQSARVWDAWGGKQLLLLRHDGWVQSVAWSPDGDSVLTAANNDAKLWNAQTGAPEATLAGHTGLVNAAVFSPNSEMAATASLDGSARLWDTDSGRLLHVLGGHSGSVTKVRFAADGKTVITGSADGTARVWDTATGEVIAGLLGHTKAVDAVALSPDGTRAVTGSSDGTGRIWTALPAAGVVTQDERYSATMCLAWSPDGTRFATGSLDNLLRIWDGRSGRQVTAVKVETTQVFGGVASIDWSPDGRFLVTTSADPTARIWDAGTGALLHVLSGHTAIVTHARYSPDGRRIVTAGYDGTVRVWDAQTGEAGLLMSSPGQLMLDARFSPDGGRIAAASTARTVPVWDSGSGAPVALLQGHTEKVGTLAWSPDGKRLLTGSLDRTARVWDAGTGAPLAVLAGQSLEVFTVAWSPDGARVAGSGTDGTGHVWSADSGGELFALRGASVAFSPDGRRIGVATAGVLREVDAATGAVVALHGGAGQALGPFAWRPDGQVLLSASHNHAARIWPVWPLSTDDTVTYSDTAALRRLTPQERAAVFLDPAISAVPGPSSAECDRLAADPADPTRAGPGVAYGAVEGVRASEACQAAVAAAPADMRLRYQLARALDRRGDPAGADAALQVAAEAGYGAALWVSGLHRQYGTRVAADGAKAVALYRRAEAAGYGPAATSLGLAYGNGAAGLGKDPAEATRWLERGAARGDPDAHRVLGMLAETGATGDRAAALLHYAIAKRLIMLEGAPDQFGVLYRTGALARSLDPAEVVRIAHQADAWVPTNPR